ncbi:sushi domain-containing protein 1 isoform X1 [Nerophis ophidion]|uniref:sushi domain-containing protein 1 isoform X1 n=1 Tax=Nerophis ophidion TaxID=159077 RepID=UPI002AE05E1A|nr:sushi domain-containing protein 1 isoform X1 [Nerophis ophidion]
MDERSAPVLILSLLWVVAGIPAAANVWDVCASCHADATCDDKSDNSGKVCNCKYGFVGNGRTLCQDKDECQIGATKICGQHTTCHNTHGSYYCTCLHGYMASNNMPVFIPNDGTHCQDIDECSVSGLCGHGAQCRNLNGSFDCSCQLGYRVQDGKEPFHPLKDKASCKVVDCGPPVLQEYTVLLSTTGTTYRSMATFDCDEGSVKRSGNNVSLCGADGLWTETTLVCEVVHCGPPPPFPHSHMLWNTSWRMGSTVLYQCNSGYFHTGDGNVSTCTAAGRWEGAPVICQEISCGKPPTLPNTGYMWNGSSTLGSIASYYCKGGFDDMEGDGVSLCTSNGNWTKPNVSCKEVDCGAPPDVSNSVLLWDHSSTAGSRVVYECTFGYYGVGERNTAVCTDAGIWDEPALLCQEITCQEPGMKAHAKRRWDGTAHVGSVVVYQCDEGYHTRSVRNYSVCGHDGQWEEFDLWCEEISCGPPQALPHTNLQWDRSTRPGSAVLYQCVGGYYQEGGDDISTCLTSGEWANVSIKCKAKCGPVPLLAHSDVVWNNRSVAIHRCASGYHSWRGRNISLCSNSGVWQTATLQCIEIKPPIDHLNVSDEKCVQWRAEKYEEDTEIYKVFYMGSRDFDVNFLEKRMRFLSSRAEWLKVCLSLLPATNYSISITAMSTGFTATVTTNTSLPVPPVPDVHYREYESPAPILRLHRSPSTLDPISFYQVVVLPTDGMMTFDCSSPANGDALSEQHSLKTHIAAQMHVSHVGADMNFTVGDGLYRGGFFNAPLEKGRNYYVVLRVVSRWKKDLKSSCVLWAKVTGTSYVVKVSSLCAAATVGLIALAASLGHAYTWFFRKKIRT